MRGGGDSRCVDGTVLRPGQRNVVVGESFSKHLQHCAKQFQRVHYLQNWAQNFNVSPLSATLRTTRFLQSHFLFINNTLS